MNHDRKRQRRRITACCVAAAMAVATALAHAGNGSTAARATDSASNAAGKSNEGTQKLFEQLATEAGLEIKILSWRNNTAGETDFEPIKQLGRQITGAEAGTVNLRPVSVWIPAWDTGTARPHYHIWRTYADGDSGKPGVVSQII